MAPRRPLLAALLSAVLLCAGCGGADPASAGADSPQPPRPVRVALWKEPLSLSLVGNPDGASTTIARLVTDALVSYDVDLKLTPQLATSWEFGDDGRSLTFHLRSGVTWHDGSPFTADDVVFTWEKVRDPATQAKSMAAQLASVRSVEALDPQTVRVTYAHRLAEALEAWTVPIIPRRAAGEGDLLHGAFAEHPVGCGPFKFVAWERGHEIRLEAYDGYWGGRPQVPGIVLALVSDERSGYQALFTGQLHLFALTPELWREAAHDPEAARRFRKRPYSTLRVYGVGWNTRSGEAPFLADPAIRRALSQSLDREGFIQAVLGAGLGRAGATCWHPDLPWTDPEVRPWAFDPAAARGALEAAGWHAPEGGGERTRNGRPLAFTLIVPSSNQGLVIRTAEWIQQSLAAVGVGVRVERLEWATFQERRRKGKFDAALASLDLDPTPDLSVLYASDPDVGQLNYGRFADTEVDRLLEEGSTEFDPAVRREIYFRLQRRVHELEPITALYHPASPLLVPADLEGLETSLLGVYAFTPGPRSWRWSGRPVP